MCAFAFTTGVISIVLLAQARAAVPTYAGVRATYHTSETSFVDRHGEPVQVLRTDPAVRKLAWTPLAEVSPALRAALVYSEDRRFYEHAGVDWQAVGAAAWGNLWNTKTRIRIDRQQGPPQRARANDGACERTRATIPALAHAVPLDGYSTDRRPPGSVSIVVKIAECRKGVP